MAIKLISWNDRSASASLLARRMGIHRIIRDPNRSRYRWRESDTLINWGMSALPVHVMEAAMHPQAVVNLPSRVGIAKDKLLTFNTLSIVGATAGFVPQFTNVRSRAEEWLEEGTKVVARSLLRSYGGRGITIVSAAEELPNAALYVKYIPKLDEYRLHVAPGDTLLYQKRRRRDVPDDRVNWQIRNFDNGFAYARTTGDDENSLYERIRNLGTRAIQVLGLHFGAVDIIYNRRADTLWILEVNTAPGLSEGTARWYASRLTQHISQMG